MQFGVDALNTRSRRAMTKLGATEEGVLRRARITWNGRVFDRVIFSVLAEEWPKVSANLESQIRQRNDQEGAVDSSKTQSCFVAGRSPGS